MNICHNSSTKTIDAIINSINVLIHILFHHIIIIKLHYFTLELGRDRIAVLPDIQPTGYPAILKTGYRIFQTSTELLK